MSADASKPLSGGAVPKEKRSGARVQLPRLVFAEVEGLRASVYDLSQTGAFIACRVPLVPGDPLPIALWLGTTEKIEVETTVRRIAPARGMAVEFRSMSQEAKARLERFLHSHTRTGIRPASRAGQ